MFMLPDSSKIEKLKPSRALTLLLVIRAVKLR